MKRMIQNKLQPLLFMAMVLPGFCSQWENSLRPVGQAISIVMENRYIIIPDEATAKEQYAATLLQKILKDQAGYPLNIKVEKEQPAGSSAFFIGNTSNQMQKPESYANPDGYSLTEDRGDWYFQGGTRRGLLNAVTSFLTEDLGYRYYSSFLPGFFINRPTTLQAVPRLFNPQFDLRTLYIVEAWDKDFIIFNHAQPIRQTPILPPELGDSISYPSSGVWFAHTFGRLAPGAELLESKPELFALINGSRCAGNCCLTNPETIRIVAENALYFLSRFPEARMFGISQNDGNNVICECDECKAVAEAESSQSGPLLHFVNAVAKIVLSSRPDVRISTLAYQQTFLPPKTIRPADGVVIFLATDQHTWSNPYHFVNETEKFRSALTEWSKVAPDIHIWEYTCADYSNWLIPFPNFDVIAENIRIFGKTPGVTGIFLQDNYKSIGSSRAAMKNWIFTQLLWNPRLKLRTLEKDFCLGYYGAAGEAMLEYTQLLHQFWKSYHEKTAPDTKPLKLDLEFYRKADAALNCALKAVREDAILSKEVMRERLCLDYLRQTLGNEAFPDSKTRLEAIEALKDLSAELGVESYGEWGNSANQLMRWRMDATIGSQKPLFAGAYVFGPDKAGLDARCGEGNASLVSDDSFPSVFAIEQPTGNSAWSIQWPVSPKEVKSGTYSIRLLLKSDTITTDGNVVRAGVYFPYLKKTVFERCFPARLLSDKEFNWLDIGEVTIPPGVQTTIFTGAARSSVVSRFWVDRVELVPISAE